MADSKARVTNAADSENAPVAGTESNDSVGEDRPESSDQVVAEAPTPTALFGPGSKVNWDNEKQDPNKRKHIGIDPNGTHNVKQFG